MFLIIILILSLSSLYELCKNKSCKGDFYFIIVFLLTLILSFRYAQGTDYFNYLSMYQSIDAGSSFFENTLYHGEIGWYMLSLLWKKMGLSFDVFIIIISIVMMSAIYRALKMSPYKMTGLLLLFPTYYLTYCFSALRQGLCVCLFLGFGLKLLFERKYLRYYSLVLAMCMIHTASAILLLAPLIIKRIKVHYPLLMVIVALLLSTMISRIPLLQQVSAISSYPDLDIGIGGIAMRLIIFLIVLHLHRMGAHTIHLYTGKR